MGSKLSKLVPSFIRKRYSAKFVVSIVFVLVIIGSVGAVGYVQVNERINQDTKDQLNSTATMQAESVGQLVDKMESQAIIQSDSDVLVDGTTDEIRDYVFSTRSITSGDVVDVHYVDTETGTVISTDSSIDGQQMSNIDEDWADESVVSPLRESSRTWVSDEQLAFASPVPAEEGEDLTKFLVLEATLEVQIAELETGQLGLETNILNAHSEMMLTPAAGIADIEPTDERQDIVSQVIRSGDVYYSDEGDHVRAYAPISGTNWVAVSSLETENAFAVRDDVGMFILFIIGAGFVSLGVMGVVLGRQTVTPLSRLKREAEQMEQGNLDVDLETGRTDEIGQLYRAFDNMRNSLRTRIDEVEEAREEATRMRDHLEDKADEYSTVMQECADGDYTRRMDPESENEAMREIASEFNYMIHEIEQTTDRLKNFATDVATSSEEVTASTEEVRSASIQVTESIQAISDGAERQNESLQSVDYEIGGLSSTIEEIASSSNEVADLAERTAQTGQEGQEAADAAIDGMNQIETESERAVEEIEALQAEIDQIDELVEFISEVAEQTNMLALNANIEAARSAESGGEGFGVVANEVKDLASETKEAAEDIEELIDGIKSQTARTAEEVQTTSDRVAQHRDAVENAASALDQIATYAQETNDGVQGISAATEQQAASTQQVVAMVDEAATISEETAAESENVAAAAEEQTSALTEVSRAISTLAEQASLLSEELDQFETDSEAEASALPAAESDGLELPETDGTVDAGDDGTGGPSEATDDFVVAEHGDGIDEGTDEPTAEVDAGADSDQSGFGAAETDPVAGDASETGADPAEEVDPDRTDDVAPDTHVESGFGHENVEDTDASEGAFEPDRNDEQSAADDQVAQAFTSDADGVVDASESDDSLDGSADPLEDTEPVDNAVDDQAADGEATDEEATTEDEAADGEATDVEAANAESDGEDIITEDELFTFGDSDDEDS